MSIFTEVAAQELLEALESMARQHCYTNAAKETESMCLGANAQALEVLEKYGRFRSIRDCGRAVVGYWPEDDPEKQQC